MSGLSTASFMGGALKGYQFGENIKDQQQDREHRGKLKQHQIDQNERISLLQDFGADTRKIALTGEIPKDFDKKYEKLGITKAMNPEWRERRKDAAALLLRSEETDSDEDVLAAANLYLHDSFNKRESGDGERRTATGIRSLPDGRLAIELEVTGKDGKKRKAPLTKNGTSNDDDEIVLLDDAKITEWQKALLGQAEIAYQIDKVKDDPKELGNLLHYIGTGQYLNKQAGFKIASLYDDETGTKRTAAINESTGQFSHWLGGAQRYNEKTGKFLGRGHAGSGGDSDDYMKMYEKYSKEIHDIETSSSFAMPEERAQAIASTKQKWSEVMGFNPDLIPGTRQQLNNRGEFRNPTLEEIQAYGHSYNQGLTQEPSLQENVAATAGMMDDKQAGRPPVPQGQPETLDDHISKVERDIQNQTDYLEKSQGGLADPNSLKMAEQKIDQLTEQRDQLMLAKQAQMTIQSNKVNPSVSNRVQSYSQLLSTLDPSSDQAAQVRKELASMIAKIQSTSQENAIAKNQRIGL